MAKLEDIPLDQLYAALDEVEEKKPTQRLMLAILYKQGPSVPMIAAWFDLRERLLYRWFSEMEEKPLLEAIYDEPPPGRPPKLTDDERRHFDTVLQEPPENIGIDAPNWTPTIARQYLLDEFDTEYTLRHVRRLLKDAGLSWQAPNSKRSTAATGGHEEVRKDFKKTD